VRALLTNKDAYDAFLKNENPYGDGHASEKIIKAILDYKSR